MKFEDVLSIQIIDYNEVAFDFVLTTKNKGAIMNLTSEILYIKIAADFVFFKKKS